MKWDDIKFRQQLGKISTSEEKKSDAPTSSVVITSKSGSWFSRHKKIIAAGTVLVIIGIGAQLLVKWYQSKQLPVSKLDPETQQILEFLKQNPPQPLSETEKTQIIEVLQNPQPLSTDDAVSISEFLKTERR